MRTECDVSLSHCYEPLENDNILVCCDTGVNWVSKNSQTAIKFTGLFGDEVTIVRNVQPLVLPCTIRHVVNPPMLTMNHAQDPVH